MENKATFQPTEMPNRAYRRMVTAKIKRMNKLRFKGRSLEQIAHITNTPLEPVQKIFARE